MAELETLVKKILSSQESLEKRMDDLSAVKGPSDAVDALKKFFGSAKNDKSMVHGWDGADDAQVIRFHGRGKAIGGPKGKSFGDWLCWNAASNPLHANQWFQGSQHPAAQGRTDQGLVRKAMSGFGSAQGWVENTVSKAPNAEGAGYTGGYLVPTQFYMKLLQFVAERSFVKALCSTQPMQGRELRFPYLNQQTTAASTAANYTASNFYGGVFFSWTPEAATYPQTNPGFSEGTLVARDLVGITVVSNQLLQDSAIALDSMLTTLFADALAWQLDYAFLRGNGVNQPLGILNAPGTIASTRAGSNNLLTSFATMMGRAVNPNTDQSQYCWIVTQSALPYLLTMTNGATNSPFLTWSNPAPNTINEGPVAKPWPATIWGMPVYITEKLPGYTTQGDIALVDMSKYLCGDRMAIQIEASQFPYFTSNQMVWRTIWRGDGQPWFNNPITLADGASTTVSPHVILAT